MTTGTSTEKISEALKLLEEAAKDKKNELKDLLKDKYGALKETVIETEHNVVDSFAVAKKRAGELAGQAKEVGQEKLKLVDDEMHKNPLAFVAGSAVVALLLGFIMGRKEK